MFTYTSTQQKLSRCMELYPRAIENAKVVEEDGAIPYITEMHTYLMQEWKKYHLAGGYNKTLPDDELILLTTRTNSVFENLVCGNKATISNFQASWHSFLKGDIP